MKRLFLSGTLLFFSTLGFADEMQTFDLVIKDHKFSQETLVVKAGEKFRLNIKNEDSTSEEFESNTMIIEKFIGPKRSISVILGPLKPGTYEYFGEFHMKTAKGQVIAK